MVQWILVYIYTPPLGAVVLIDWNNAYGNAFARKMSFPKGLGPWFANDSRFTCALSIRLLFLNSKRPIGFFEPIKDV